MNWVFGVVAVTLALLFAWGLLAPRSQWRVLGAWAVSDSYAHEPGGSGYGLRRLLSAVGLLAVGLVLALGATPMLTADTRDPAPPRTAVEAMWGHPAPHLVARVVRGAPAADPTLAAGSVLAFQSLEDAEELPTYLLNIPTFSLLGARDVPGLIGAEPEKGLSAFGAAQLVVKVRGPILCIPRQAVVVETETTVQIGIYYGLPDSADGAPRDHLAGCPADGPLTASVLIPIVLAAPLGDRDVQLLDGSSLSHVPVVTD